MTAIVVVVFAVTAAAAGAACLLWKYAHYDWPWSWDDVVLFWAALLRCYPSLSNMSPCFPVAARRHSPSHEHQCHDDNEGNCTLSRFLLLPPLPPLLRLLHRAIVDTVRPR